MLGSGDRGAPRNGELWVTGSADTVEHVRQLAASLRAAIRARDALTGLEADRARIAGELAHAERRLDGIAAAIAALTQAAATTDETDLDGIITSVARQDVLGAAERNALDELAGMPTGE